MKILRLLTFMLVAVLVFSTWAPALALQSNPSPANSADLAKTKLARLRVTNRTGGTLFVSFSGPRSYNFSTGAQGRTTFEAVIQPGKYRIDVRASACPGTLHFTKNVKGGTVGLPPFVCRRK